MEDTAKERLQWIDISKGLGIIFVVLGHYMQTLHLNFGEVYTDIFFWIYSFHMPLFFFLSGFVYKDYEIKIFLKKKIRGLLLPVIVFSCIYTLYKIFVIKENINWIEALLCKSNSYIHLYWFVWTLLWTQVIYYLLDKIIRRRILILLISFFVLAVCMIVNGEGILLTIPFCLGNTPYLLPFFAIGVNVNEKKSSDNQVVSGRFLIVLFLLDIVVCTVFKFGISYALLSFDFLPLDYFKALLGIVIVVYGSKIIEQCEILWIPAVLQKMGKESLWIYLIHGFFFWGLFKKGLYFIPQNNTVILLYSFLFTIMTVFLIYFGIVTYRHSMRNRSNVLQYKSKN